MIISYVALWIDAGYAKEAGFPLKVFFLTTKSIYASDRSVAAIILRRARFYKSLMGYLHPKHIKRSGNYDGNHFCFYGVKNQDMGSNLCKTPFFTTTGNIERELVQEK